MKSVKRGLAGKVTGIWVALVLCGLTADGFTRDLALAENSANRASSTSIQSTGSLSTGSLSTRGDWEQRVLRQPNASDRHVSEPTSNPIPHVATHPSNDISDGGVRLVSGEIQFDTLPPDDAYETTFDAQTFEEPGEFVIDSEMGQFDDCGGCGQYGVGLCDKTAGCDGCFLGFPRFCSSWWARDLSIFAGVHGFKGP
ncbi:MAG TPA: hypothetical protein VE890_07810, partial [Thermoguttaceae bacterium]|nr:hypothetical protein [Thermoguttaceae bacterium]